jgi:hypothetical protein
MRARADGIRTRRSAALMLSKLLLVATAPKFHWKLWQLLFALPISTLERQLRWLQKHSFRYICLSVLQTCACLLFEHTPERLNSLVKKEHILCRRITSAWHPISVASMGLSK